MKETLGTIAVEDKTEKGQHSWWSEQNEPQLTKRREH